MYDALWRAVQEGRIIPFDHPLSQTLLSRENALLCVRSALETPSKDKPAYPRGGLRCAQGDS